MGQRGRGVKGKDLKVEIGRMGWDRASRCFIEILTFTIGSLVVPEGWEVWLPTRGKPRGGGACASIGFLSRLSFAQRRVKSDAIAQDWLGTP